mmetsp:Transcript_18911/g.55775  ORF Transcript_18911/g.55775 Transcript_18911/m.55775 type:complete len:148 (+) Transcript_18911:3-446(+)
MMVPILALTIVVPPPLLCQRALLTHRAVRAEIKLSLIEQTKTGGFDLWNALAEPFAEAAGVEFEAAGMMNRGASEFEKALIDLEQFTALMASLGDDLPEDQAGRMFASVDADGDGKIEFVQVYKAISDEARFGGAEGGGFLGGLFGR